MSRRRLDGWLGTIRTDDSRWATATVLGALLGLAVANVHWSGLLLGGALVALPQRSVRTGLAAGLGFGVLVVLAFALRLALAGALDTYLGMGQVLAVSVVISLGTGLLGALVRGIR